MWQQVNPLFVPSSIDSKLSLDVDDVDRANTHNTTSENGSNNSSMRPIQLILIYFWEMSIDTEHRI